MLLGICPVCLCSSCPLEAGSFCKNSTPVKTSYFLFCWTLLFLMWELRRCKSGVLLQHVSVSKQQLSSPSFTTHKSTQEASTHGSQCDTASPPSEAACMCHRVWKGARLSEPRRDTDKGSGLRGKAKCGRVFEWW